MTTVDYIKLKKLREETGISFALCKKALEETKNDIQAAKKKLIEWGAKKVEEKSGRSTGQGGIFSYAHHNNRVAALVELLCETDFVSGNSEFQELGKMLAMQVASMPAKSVDTLLAQEYIREPGKTIQDLLKEAVLKFGENIKIARFIRLQLGE